MNVNAQRALLRQIPQVDFLLRQPAFSGLVEKTSQRELTTVLRNVLEDLRHRALTRGDLRDEELDVEALAQTTKQQFEERDRPYYRRVINATGVILHTALGRAPLANAAVEALASSARAQRVEIDLDSGQRGGRDRGCVELIRELTGCEAATVVNNNAAATVLILGALARGRRVLVSRGELVEIGGSYRIPDIMRESGAILAEVGTTNRTHLRDYEQAIDDETGLILKVHTSNYRVVGFTKEVGLPELSNLARTHDLPLVHDMGSGCLIDLERRGFPHEPSVQRSLREGADLVCFSGDKLLGGPQAGILAGRADLIDRCRRHPLYRAMRPGRLIYTALEATLRLYRRGEATACEQIPALRRLTTSDEALEKRALTLQRLLQPLTSLHRVGLECTVVRCSSQAGSGSLPTQEFNSWAVRLMPRDTRPDALARALRLGDPALLVRIRGEALLLDMRTLDDDELPDVADCLDAACSFS